MWAWGLNLHYLTALKIDVAQLIRYTPQEREATTANGHAHHGRPSPHYQTQTHHGSTYRLATTLSAVLGSSLVLFWLLTRRDPQRVVDLDWLPMSTLLALALVFAFPPVRGVGARGGGPVWASAAGSYVSSLPHSGRMRLLATLRRVSVGGLARTRDGKFGDILLADALTSYAKVIGDLYVAICMFVTPDGSSTARPDRSCGGTVVVPALMALPSLIRLRQCLIEYGRVRRSLHSEESLPGGGRPGGGGDLLLASSSPPSSGWGGQHLANAAKYASAFPVIVLSALMRSAQRAADGSGDGDVSTPGLYRAWLVAVLFNSLYGFYWDVAKDWDLTLFSSSRDRSAPDHPWGLRRRLMIHVPAVYYIVIVLDLLLRCTWSIKLSAHLDHVADFESSLFLVELAEVFRRWVWIFFRVEAEWLRNIQQPVGLGTDDAMLADYVTKYDDEEY